MSVMPVSVMLPLPSFCSFPAPVMLPVMAASAYAARWNCSPWLVRPGAYENVNGACDESEAFCYNAFPGPLDSLANQPFDGTYDRTFPYNPPSRRSVLP